jgi:polar amino acid transport system permease protein
MQLDPTVITDSWQLFVTGAFITLQLSLISFVLGLLLAVPVAALSMSSHAVLNGIAILYLAIIRGVPFIAIVFIVHYGTATMGARTPAFWSGVIALTLFASAYFSEVIRSTVSALPPGQWDSGRVVGMSRLQTLRYIIIPQSLGPMIPPGVNVTIMMIKESSVISAITVGELTYQGLVVQGNTFAPFEVFITVALIYWGITLAFSRVAIWAERRIGASQRSIRPVGGIAERYLTLSRPKRRAERS